MYGSSFGNEKKPCDMKQTCGGLSTLGRNYIYIIIIIDLCVGGGMVGLCCFTSSQDITHYLFLFPILPPARTLPQTQSGPKATFFPPLPFD